MNGPSLSPINWRSTTVRIPAYTLRSGNRSRILQLSTLMYCRSSAALCATSWCTHDRHDTLLRLLLPAAFQSGVLVQRQTDSHTIQHLLLQQQQEQQYSALVLALPCGVPGGYHLVTGACALYSTPLFSRWSFCDVVSSPGIYLCDMVGVLLAPRTLSIVEQAVVINR